MGERPFWCHCEEEYVPSSAGSRASEPCKQYIIQEDSEPKLCFHRIKDLEKKVDKLCGEVGFSRKCSNREIALSRCLCADLNMLEDSNNKCLEKMEQLIAGFPKLESDFVKLNGDLDKKLYGIEKENEELKKRLSQLEKKENVLNSDADRRSKDNTDLRKRILELNNQFSKFRIDNDKALKDYKKYANGQIERLIEKHDCENFEPKEIQASDSSEMHQIQNVQNSPSERILKNSERPVRKSNIKGETSKPPFKNATSPKRKTTPKKRPTTVHHDCECSIAVHRQQLKELQDLCNSALNQNRSSMSSISKAQSAARRISINKTSVFKSTRSTSTSGFSIPTASNSNTRTVEQARHVKGKLNKASQVANVNNEVNQNLAKAIGKITKGTLECLGQLKKINDNLKRADETLSNDILATLEQFVNEREECMENFRKVNMEYNCGQEALEKINSARSALDNFKKQMDQLKKSIDEKMKTTEKSIDGKTKTTEKSDDSLKEIFMQSYKSTATYFVEK